MYNKPMRLKKGSVYQYDNGEFLIISTDFIWAEAVMLKGNIELIKEKFFDIQVGSLIDRTAIEISNTGIMQALYED